MKFSLLLILAAAPFLLWAQSSNAYIAFSIADTLHQPVNNEAYTISIHAGNTAATEKDITGAVQYDATTKLFYLTVDEVYRNSIIRIDVNKKSAPSDKTSVTFNLSARFHSPAEFKNILVLNIPVLNKSMVADMPMQEVSWQYIPLSKKKIDNREIEFRDITFMQNWKMQ